MVGYGQSNPAWGFTRDHDDLQVVGHQGFHEESPPGGHGIHPTGGFGEDRCFTLAVILLE